MFIFHEAIGRFYHYILSLLKGIAYEQYQEEPYCRLLCRHLFFVIRLCRGWQRTLVRKNERETQGGLDYQ